MNVVKKKKTKYFHVLPCRKKKKVDKQQVNRACGVSLWNLCVSGLCVFVHFLHIKTSAWRWCLWNPLGCRPRLPALLFTIERHSRERKDRAEPADLTQSHPYLCQQTTRLNFPPESPMMRADITGGYSPCLLLRPYKMRRIRYGATARWVGGGRWWWWDAWDFAFDFLLHPVNSGNFKQRKVCWAWNTTSCESPGMFPRLVVFIADPWFGDSHTKGTKARLCLPPHSLIISELILLIVVSASTVAYLFACVRMCVCVWAG